MGKISDDPAHWRRQTDLYLNAQSWENSFQDHRRTQLLARFGEFQIYLVPLKHPDLSPDARSLGELIAVSADHEVVAILVVTEIIDYQGLSGFLYGDIQVDPRYRRQGLMTRMYDVAERLFRLEFDYPEAMRQEHPASADALAFWNARAQTRAQTRSRKR